MESLNYINDMLEIVNNKKLIDILDYLAYIARDNKKYETDDFISEIINYIENGVAENSVENIGF